MNWILGSKYPGTRSIFFPKLQTIFSLIWYKIIFPFKYIQLTFSFMVIVHSLKRKYNVFFVNIKQHLCLLSLCSGSTTPYRVPSFRKKSFCTFLLNIDTIFTLLHVFQCSNYNEKCINCLISDLNFINCI